MKFYPSSSIETKTVHAHTHTPVQWNIKALKSLMSNKAKRIDIQITKQDHSWVKRGQLDVTCFIISLYNAQHVSDVNTSILRSLRLMCWFISWITFIWFDVCWSYVVVWLWWCGIRMQVEACIRIPHHHRKTTT